MSVNNAYTQPVDIANRALQHLGKPHLNTLDDSSEGAHELGFSYDKVRQAELRRNLWRFATRRAILRPFDTTTMALVFPAWAAGAYLTGDVVMHDGMTWVATEDNPTAAPTNAYASGWDSYFGPVWAQRYIAQSAHNHTTAGYQAGEWVFIPYGNGQAAVYQCVMATNQSPLQILQWDPEFLYQTGSIVGYPLGGIFTLGVGGSITAGPDLLGSSAYSSLGNLNFGNEPDLTSTGSPQPNWDAGTTWTPTQYVMGTDGQIYLNILTSTGIGGITGENPVVDYPNTFWTPTGMFSGAWQYLSVPAALSPDWRYYANVTLAPISLVWPMGAGPLEDTTSQNVYHVPANWLREAPEEPKQGLIPWLGGPTGQIQKDWVFEGDYIVTRNALPLLVRFVADVQNVAAFDPMFCEAFALNLAIENASAVDSAAEGQQAMSKYAILVNSARVVNAIEIGPVVPPDCQLISVRY